ncbi:hypothetical protein FZEAL_5108 [Fusarium zealandicum]|uniref:AAA+ ATPase domain-containing protein n=1 Tax=Fusarium zealandicum TaxID=1053134 RepID=A0A8H4UL59_9HYPO|nr:hypothetical protein FZEAL_5108 [Fusarium zealandicum]
MLADSIDAKVRPLANAALEKSSLLGAARIYVSRDSLLSLTGALENGKHCLVTPLATENARDRDGVLDDDDVQEREATLWILPEKNLSPNVVMMTRAFQDATGFRIGGVVRISLLGVTPDAEQVVVEDVTERTEKNASDFDRLEKYEKEVKNPLPWEDTLTALFDRASQVFPGMVLEATIASRFRRSFKVVSVNSQTTILANFKIASSAVRVLDADCATNGANKESRGELVVTGVPGMSRPLEALNQFLSGFSRAFYHKRELISCGFIIHGGHGTGKTFMLERVAATNWGRVHQIKPSAKAASIKETFKSAFLQQPSIILIDELDALISEKRNNRESIIDILSEQLDALSFHAESNNALPDVVVIATCIDYLTTVPVTLQKRSRFFLNVALAIPGPKERLEILTFLDPPVRLEEKQQLLENIAQKTYAYTPQDLCDVVFKATRGSGIRLSKAGVSPGVNQEHFIEKGELEEARKATRPTAMNDINLKPPTIHWDDIGGQQHVKDALSRMIKYAKNPERFLRSPPKSLVLYGPPGCSKTLSAQAAATESGFNFFAVKGAELLNMYVGETERAVRNLFERARNAAPSIIFFDEIDSIGGQRSSGSGSRSANGVNILTTLLTEIDGFETLSGVFLLAATNRPEAMDKAIMRPGRFDQALYIGPPDEAAREAVFRVHLRGLPLASDVDLQELSRLADGCSGAEIKSVCDKTAWEVQGRYDDDEIANKLELSMKDLTSVLEQTPRHITQAMIDGYKKWAETLAGKK